MQQAVYFLLLFLGFVGVALPQPRIAYVLPDLATPALPVLVEILAPASAVGSFGADGFYTNDSNSTVRLTVGRIADSASLTFGPLVVSNGGRLITSFVFASRRGSAGESDWHLLPLELRIPIIVTSNGLVSNADSIYLVDPQQELRVTGTQRLGDGSDQGIRSRRGAIIAESLNQHVRTRLSQFDADPSTVGNQGFLPSTILLTSLANNVRLDASGDSVTAGPGGGGGGGILNDINKPAIVFPGGDGFTGGQGSISFGGEGSGARGIIASHGGSSLSGVAGGRDKPGSNPNNADTLGEGLQGTGGGSGHPFGTSGEGSFTKLCVFDNSVGGYGGGSGASSCWPVGFGGGGGGNAVAGSSASSGGGKVHGNPMIIPVSGGSGGAGGNPWYGQAGYGGGGGGGVSVFANGFATLELAANGANGGDQYLNLESYYSGAGGGGSGGNLRIGFKLPLSSLSVEVAGGKAGQSHILHPGQYAKYQAGGDGGAGRVRIDGPIERMPTMTPGASFYRGPSTDTSHYVNRSFTLTGTGNGEDIKLFLKSDEMEWTEIAMVSGYANNSWQQPITLPGTAKLYYLVAAQRVPNPSTTEYTSEPSWVMSQAAANILEVVGCERFVTPQNQTNFAGVYNQTLSFPIRLGFSSRVNWDSLKQTVETLEMKFTYNAASLRATNVLTRPGWSLQGLNNTTPGVLTVSVARTSAVMSPADPILDIEFLVKAQDKRLDILSLESIHATTLTEKYDFCLYTEEGDGWVIGMNVPSGVTARDWYLSDIYPNPAQRDITLRGQNAHAESTISMTVLDILGREVLHQRAKITQGDFSTSLDISSLAAGQYMLIAEIGGIREVRRFEKQ